MPLPIVPKIRGSILQMSATMVAPLVIKRLRKGSKTMGEALRSIREVIDVRPGEADVQPTLIEDPKLSAAMEMKVDVIPESSPSHRRAGRNKPAKSVGHLKIVGLKSATGKQKAPLLKPKLFVLDTNVLLHDPACLLRFEEHDVFIPMVVLEELDGKKGGLTDLARSARQVSRILDQVAVNFNGGNVMEGMPLSALGNSHAKGRLFFQTEPVDEGGLPKSLPTSKADNQILEVFNSLRRKHADREVVLVSKDINMRIKAKALGLQAEDYTSDHSLDDSELLYSGTLKLPQNFWNQIGKTLESWEHGGRSFYRIKGKIVEQMHINQFVFLDREGDALPWSAQVTEIANNTAVLRTVKDHAAAKNCVMGVQSRNREQNFALNLLTDPAIDFVTIAGPAGTGKTLMVLAAGLAQIISDKRYNEIIFTRATVSVGEEIGFLPGNEEEKMAPWMGAVDDNLEVLAGNHNHSGDWGRAHSIETIKSLIKIKSMSFMRGRTFQSKFLIIDEAQNLTPKQMKTLVTRAGPGTKIVCMGNLAQIDTPYLTEGSSGLTYVVERFKGWAHGGHITLAKGERSRLADFASDVL